MALFRELAQLTVLDEGSPNAFRVRAYENAVEAIASLPGRPGGALRKELTAIDGIGPSTAKKIREFFEGGTIAKLEELRQKYPAGVRGARQDPRPRAQDAAAAPERARRAQPRGPAGGPRGPEGPGLHGLGAKMEEKLLLAIARMGTTGKDKRRPIAEAMPIARELVAGARGAARGRARPVLRQPAAPARDRGRRRHRGGLARAGGRAARPS